MPIVNSSQARIELSGKQVTEFIDLVHAHFAEPEQIVMISIEETNIRGVHAFEGVGAIASAGLPLTLVSHNGESHALGGSHGD